VKARILLVDDHEVVRDGLRLKIRHQPDMEVIGEAGNGRVALERAKALSPDLVLVDIHMEGMNGIELSRQLLREHPQMKIVVLSAFPDPDTVNQAVQAGVCGYLLKANAADDLLRAIRVVLAGKTYFCPEVAAAVVADYRRLLLAKENPPPPLLSEREREVLKLTAEGARTKEIAAQLHISLKTVETHRAHLMTKLGCSSVVELTRYALREGIASL
jgi:DNA-binding NarL/FixJ family response regulator